MADDASPVDDEGLGNARGPERHLCVAARVGAKPLVGVAMFAKEGFDPQFGARPLKRAVQDLLLDPLANKLLLGEFKPGDRIKVMAHDGELEFEKA